MLIGVPVKPFGVAKARLAPLLDPTERSRIGIAVAARTLEVASLVGRSTVVTGDDGVAAWAEGLGHGALLEQPGGLDGAAVAVTEAAGTAPWLFVHADLPLLEKDDLQAAIDALLAHGSVLSPSSDGGTALVGGIGSRSFSFGPGSFHRHLAATPDARVVVRRGLALDLDTPADYRAWRHFAHRPTS